MTWTQDRRRDWNRPGSHRRYDAPAGPLRLVLIGSEQTGWQCLVWLHTRTERACVLPFRRLRCRTLAGAQREAERRVRGWVETLTAAVAPLETAPAGRARRVGEGDGQP